jgi:hypothetical protein
MKPLPSSLEFSINYDLLNAEVGSNGSGAMRYGAAMFFYKLGSVSEEMLEIYRSCSKFDAEDPVDVARFEGVATWNLDVEAASDTAA